MLNARYIRKSLETAQGIQNYFKAGTTFQAPLELCGFLLLPVAPPTTALLQPQKQGKESMLYL
jgi:hypothetical protein